MAQAGEATAALDIGFGPQTLLFYGAPEPYRHGQGGFVVSTHLLLDSSTLQGEAEALPWPWRLAASKAKVRYNPFPYLPDSIILSPGFGQGGALGVSWGLGQVGVDLLKEPRLRLGGGGGHPLSQARGGCWP